MAKYKYTRNLPLATGFQVESKRPLDAKEFVKTFDDLLTVPGAYPGMEVKVEDEAYKKYKWTGINQSDATQWTESGGGALPADVLTQPDANQPVTAGNKLATMSDLSSAGGGDVTGPAIAVVDNLAAFSSISGKIIKDSGKKLSDLASTTDLALKADKTQVLTNVPAGAVFTDTQIDPQQGTGITIDKTNPLAPIFSSTGGGGSGDVVGPNASVDENIAIFDGVTGKLIKDGGKKLSDLASTTDLASYIKYTDANQAVSPTNKVATMADVGAAGGGTVTNVGVTIPLTVTNPTTTPHIAINPTTLAQWNAAQPNVKSDWSANSGDAEVLNKPATITPAQASSITANTAKVSNVQADWDATAGLAVILHKPTIPPAYNLPTASATIKGGIKIGSGLTMTGEVLSASGGGATVDPASQAEVDSGTVDNKYISPKTLENSVFRQNFAALELRVNGIDYTPAVPGSPDSNLQTDHIGISVPMRMEGNQVVPTSPTDRPAELATFSTVGTMVGQATSAIPFTQLNDTPSDYTGAADKVLAVKHDESGVEFIDAPSGGKMEVKEITSNYSAGAADNGYFIRATGAVTEVKLNGYIINFNQILYNGTNHDINIKIGFNNIIEGINQPLPPGYHATYVQTYKIGSQFVWAVSTPYLDNTNYVESIVAGTNITVDNTDPEHPIVSSSGLQTIVAGNNISIDNTTPGAPIVNANVGTTAGITTRVYYTGELETVGGNSFYKTKVGDKGSVASAPETVNVNDNEKKWFTVDAIGSTDAIPYTAPGGIYEGQLTVKGSINGGEQRFTMEVYMTDVNGVVIDSGISSIPVGDLGVRPIMVADSGILDLVANNETNVTLSGFLAQPFSVPANNRFRYHVSGEKIGTAGGAETLTLYYGSDYHSYLNVPAEITTDGIINDSNVTGHYLTEALNKLETDKVGKDTTGTTTHVDNLWTGTQAEYDLLTPVATVVYFIAG